MDEKEKREYEKQLEYFRELEMLDKEGFARFKAANPKAFLKYDEKLTISGFHITHTVYDKAVFQGFSRREDSIEIGQEKRKESLEQRKKLDEELQHYLEQFPNATKDDKDAMKALKKIKNKYKEVLSIRDDNQRRKINKFKHKVQANFDEWTHFITLSIKENLVGTEGIKQSKELLKEWAKKMRKLDENFLYCYVIEFQKRGGSHFHVITSFDKGKAVPKTRFKEIRKTWEHLGSINIKGIRMKYDRDVGKKIKEQTDQELKLVNLSQEEQIAIVWSIGNYLTSYLKKGADDVLLFGSKMYGGSEGLKDEITITDKRKIAPILKYLGIEQLKEKEYQVDQKVFENGEQIESDAKITMKFYNKLIKKDKE